MKMKTGLSLALWSLFVVSAPAQDTSKDLEAKLLQNPNDVATLIQLGRLYHDQGVAGDKGAVDKGFSCFDKVLELDHANAVALVYRGSLWTLRGRDAWWPFTKMSHVEKGIDEMDRSADLAPDNITVRLARGINSVQLPDMFHRLPVALKDFNYLLNFPNLSKFDPQLQSSIYCWAGIANKHDSQPGKAKEMLRRAIALAPGSRVAAKAEAELKEIQ